MKKLAMFMMMTLAFVFSACSSGEFYELKKSPCACDLEFLNKA